MFVNGNVTNSEQLITQNYTECINARDVLWLIGAGFSVNLSRHYSLIVIQNQFCSDLSSNTPSINNTPTLMLENGNQC